MTNLFFGSLIIVVVIIISQWTKDEQVNNQEKRRRMWVAPTTYYVRACVCMWQAKQQATRSRRPLSNCQQTWHLSSYLNTHSLTYSFLFTISKQFLRSESTTITINQSNGTSWKFCDFVAQFEPEEKEKRRFKRLFAALDQLRSNPFWPNSTPSGICSPFVFFVTRFALKPATCY